MLLGTGKTGAKITAVQKAAADKAAADKAAEAAAAEAAKAEAATAEKATAGKAEQRSKEMEGNKGKHPMGTQGRPLTQGKCLDVCMHVCIWCRILRVYGCAYLCVRACIHVGACTPTDLCMCVYVCM